MTGYLFFLVAVGGPVFALLFNGWKAWDFRTSWKTVQATTLSSDYDEDERLADDAPFAFLWRGRLSDVKGKRWTKFRIAYTDARGGKHEAKVKRLVYRGHRPPASMTIRYDTRAPGRVDVFGAGGAVMNMVVWGVVLTAVLHGLSGMNVAAIAG